MPMAGLVVRWPMPPVGRAGPGWTAANRIVTPAIGSLCKLFAKLFVNIRCHNIEKLIKAVEERPSNLPLLTACNHHSCIDDPFLWGSLPLRVLWNCDRMRWTLAAHDICFTRELDAKFFSFGQTIPVIRGEGVYQRGMDYCVELLNIGKWVHVYPEGKVNLTPSEFLRLKWGVGRLIAESVTCPLVLPFWHVGMDKVLPNEEPLIPRLGQVVTLNVGDPIDFSELRQNMEADRWDATSKRKKFTDIIQEHFRKLRQETESLHCLHLKDLGRIPS